MGAFFVFDGLCHRTRTMPPPATVAEWLRRRPAILLPAPDKCWDASRRWVRPREFESHRLRCCPPCAHGMGTGDVLRSLATSRHVGTTKREGHGRTTQAARKTAGMAGTKHANAAQNRLCPSMLHSTTSCPGHQLAPVTQLRGGIRAAAATQTTAQAATVCMSSAVAHAGHSELDMLVAGQGGGASQTTSPADAVPTPSLEELRQRMAFVATTVKGLSQDIGHVDARLLCGSLLAGGFGALPCSAHTISRHIAHASTLLTHLLDRRLAAPQPY